MTKQFFVRRDYTDIFPFLESISAQADSERDALGFLPQAAYAEAARQRKLILLVAQDREKTSYAGHLLFGGIFPILRVRQIVVATNYRRQHHASLLLRTLIAQGENEAYLNIVANVATDLTAANSFYERHGFLSSRLKAGGKTRNRKINVRILQLDTPSLISYMVAPTAADAIEILPRKRSPGTPIYAIDLNVFFDAVRDRTRSQDAGAVFEAAFKHQIRIAASQEFSAELRRTSSDPNHDPILSLARTIPTLPLQEKNKIESLKPHIASLVFPERSARGNLKSTDESDILHLAHAVAAGTSGYVTSDAKVLAARDRLMKSFGLDVIGLSEFVHLLDTPNEAEATPTPKATKSFRIQATTVEEVTAFLRREGVSTESHLDISRSQRLAVFDNDGLIGIGLLNPSPALERPSHSVVCVHQEHPFSSTVADFLISEHVRHCSNKAAYSLLLLDISSHPITRRIALGQGFQHVHGHSGLFKVALGRPATEANWNDARLAVERISGITIQEKCPRYDKPEVTISTNGVTKTMGLFEFETLLSPTLLALPKRKAVVVPITRAFAADLLGTDAQYSFLEVPEAHFLSRRTYFNTTRAARVMIRGSVIAFYESLSGKGRGALVALGRILDVTSIPASNTPELLQRGGVVEDTEALTKSKRILATTFDNLVILRTPISFGKLQQLGCVSGTNFVSATPISAKQLASIVHTGFSDD